MASPSTVLNPAFKRDVFERQIHRIAPAARRYLIVFTPRCGSTWLTRALGDTGFHGKPQEYAKESRQVDLARVLNAEDNRGILEMLLRKRKSDNNVFGMKVTSTHVTSFGESTFFEFFPQGTPIYQMWRRNIVAQAISLFRAVETRRFHSVDEAAPAPAYDGAKIGQWLEHILQIENGNNLMLARQDRRPTVICYEDIVDDPNRVLAVFAEILGEDQPAPVMPRETSKDLRKIGDAWNLETEDRYRSGNRAIVSAVEARRLMTALPSPCG